MLAKPWAELGELAIRSERDAFDLPVMIADEPYVADEPTQALPPREPACVNDETLQLAVRFDPRIGSDRQLVEVTGSHGLRHFHDDHADVGEQPVGESGRFHRQSVLLGQVVGSVRRNFGLLQGRQLDPPIDRIQR